MERRCEECGDEGDHLNAMSVQSPRCMLLGVGIDLAKAERRQT